MDENRRRFLALAVWGAALVALPKSARGALPQADRPRRLAFHNLHTEERLAVTYWERGAYVPAALGEIDAILRDHRTGEIRPMAPGLLDLLHALNGRLGGPRTIQIVSGYRSAATNAMLHSADPLRVAEASRHLNGEALDLCVDGRSLRRVRDAALALAAGGVGYYPRTGFVHVDVGPVRVW